MSAADIINLIAGLGILACAAFVAWCAYDTGRIAKRMREIREPNTGITVGRVQRRWWRWLLRRPIRDDEITDRRSYPRMVDLDGEGGR